MRSSGPESVPPDLGTGVVLALGVLLWWSSSPFLGAAHHDSLLYAADALHRLAPGSFTRDPFFAGQTQGRYSIFGALYAQLITLVGLPLAAWLFSLAGRLLWLFALLRLVRRLWPHSPHWPLLGVLALLLPRHYDSGGFFSYAEPLATARCWAEAMVLTALGFQAGGQRVLAWAAMGLAAILHPLMALPGVLLLCLLQPPRLRAGLLVTGLGLLGLGAWLGLQPLAGLLQVFDDAWWQIVIHRVSYLLPWSWGEDAWLRVLLWACVLLYSWRSDASATIRHLAGSLAVALALGLAIWMLAAWSRNVLLMQLQPWRVLWLVQLMAPVLWAAGWMNHSEWRLGERLHLGLMVVAISSVGWGSLLVVPALFCLHPRAVVWLERHAALNTSLWPVLWLACAALLLLNLSVHWAEAHILHAIQDMLTPAWPAWWVVLSSYAWLGLPGLWWGWIAGKSLPAQPHLARFAVLTLLLLLASLWVQEGRRQLRPHTDAAALRAHIPPGALVYWGSLADTWLLLNRAHYASWQQGAGVVFSREAALTLAARLKRLEQLGLAVDPRIDRPAGTAPPRQTAAPRPASEQARQLCADPALDYAILGQAGAGSTAVDLSGRQVHVFECRSLARKDPP